MFNIAASTHLRAGIQAARFVGGLYHQRDHIGDPESASPSTSIRKKTARSATFPCETILWTQSLQLFPSLLNKLAPERLYGFTFAIIARPIDYPLHRTILALQLLPIFELFYVSTLARVEDIQLRQSPDADYLSVSEIFQTISNAVWAELLPPASPTSQPSQKTPTKSLFQALAAHYKTA